MGQLTKTVTEDQAVHQGCIRKAHAYAVLCLGNLMLVRDKDGSRLANVLCELLVERLGGEADYLDHSPRRVIENLLQIPDDPDCGPELADSARRLAERLSG